jgi:hypothetical protein
VNCGPRSNFLYIAITVYYFTCLFTFLHTITFYHSIRSILYLQQTGEIDNLIVSWGKVLGCVVCRFHVAVGEKLHADKQLSSAIVRSVAKLASINLLKFGFLLLVRLNLGFTTEGNLLLSSSYLPLGVPNWYLTRTINGRLLDVYTSTPAELTTLSRDIFDETRGTNTESLH